MRLLLVHQNFPGQFKHLAKVLGANPKVRVVALGEQKNIAQVQPPAGVTLVPYRLHRAPGREVHPYLRTTEAAVLRGQAVARACLQLKKRGFTPDVIYVHPAWGEALYLRDIYPDSRILAFFEFYYRSEGTDFGFDPEFPTTLDDRLRIRTWNMVHQSTLFSVDWGLSPTHWQASVFPEEFRARMSVIHDGIDTRALRPNPAASFNLPDGRRLDRQQEVITFVSRGLEPYRGFHVFMRALPELMRRRPQAQVVIVGGDRPSYGRRPKDAPNWREKLMREVGAAIDRSRLHFVGRLAYPDFISLLQVSRAHVYLTYPFVLSWSLLEAMALAVPIVASDTAPVIEVIEDGRHGLLTEFFDQAALVEHICKLLDNTDLSHSLGEAARARVRADYDLWSVCLPAQLDLIRSLARGRRPSAHLPSSKPGVGFRHMG